MIIKYYICLVIRELPNIIINNLRIAQFLFNFLKFYTMKKINVFSLVAFVPWVCFVYLLFICDACTVETCEPSDIFKYNQIDFQVIDSKTQAVLFQGIRPGGIYPSSKVKVVLEHGELAKNYKMEIDDIASFTYADSSDTDALEKTKSKFFYLHLVNNFGFLDVDTININFKYKYIKECGFSKSEKVQILYNSKIATEYYGNGTTIQFQKNL